MPKAIVTYGTIDSVTREKATEWFRTYLPLVIAMRLGVPDTDAELTRTDVEVRFEQAGTDDVNTYMVQVEIHANDYPERRAILKEGTRIIWNTIAEALPELDGKFFVWPLLGIGEFVDSPG